MRSIAALLLLALSTLVPACAGSSDDDDTLADGEALSAGVVTATVQKALLVRHPSEQNRTWTVTQGNAFAGGGILPMPVASAWGKASLPAPRACASSGDCVADFGLATCASDADCRGGACVALAATKQSDADAARSVCAGHSDAVLDEIYGLVTSAHERVDITSLAPPTGRFLAALRNAVTTLDRRRERVVVRFLFASYFNTKFDPTELLSELTRDVKPGSRLLLTVGSHTGGLTTWNHSKIIAVDGKEAIVGGMNLIGEHYLDADPVHDVSVHVKGPVVGTMHTYVNELWQTVCSDAHDVAMLDHGAACAPYWEPRPIPAAGNTTMIGIGRLGTSRDAAKTGIAAMIDTARRSVRISQQDIGSVKLPGGVLVVDYVDAFIRAARRGVDIQVVLSNDDATAGKGDRAVDSYSNGWTREALWRWIDQRAAVIWPDAHPALCKHLHLSTLRDAGRSTWADGHPLANHAKVVIVDEAAYYVGSQNLYDANLAEYGVIVDDAAATKDFAATYFAKVAGSAKTPYVDSSCR